MRSHCEAMRPVLVVLPGHRFNQMRKGPTEPERSYGALDNLVDSPSSEDAISEARKHLRCVSFPNLTGVLTQSYVADVVGAVFDAPMTAIPA